MEEKKEKDKAASEAAALLGRRGRGKSKRRGDSAYYKKIRGMRKDKKEAVE